MFFDVEVRIPQLLKCRGSDASKYQILGITTVGIEGNDWALSEAADIDSDVAELRFKRQFYCRMMTFIIVAL